MATLRQDLGPVTAYAYAVSQGYTGTEEEFAEVLANFADSAEQVAADAAQVALDKGAVHDDKEAVDSAEGRVTSAVNTFTTTTAPNAVTAVENAGTAQIGLVEAEGTRQIGLVADKGTEQVGTVSSEGTTQIGLVEAKGAEVIASIPGDYSTLQGDIASTYSSSSTYAVGDYVLYSGQLYRCTTAISTAEAWTSAKWTAVALGDDVTDLKSAIDESTEYKLTKISGTTYKGKYISSAQNTYGQLIDISGTAWEYTDYVDVSECNHVAITASGYSSRLYYCFYDSGKNPIAGSGKDYISGVSLTDEIVKVPTGAKYCVAGWYLNTGSNDPIIKKAEIIPKISDDSVTTAKIKNGAVTEEKIEAGLFIKAIPSKNLFDISTITSSSILAYNSNQTSASDSYDTSDFIPVKAGKSYTISPSCRIYCLSTDKTSGTVSVYNNENVTTSRTISVASDGYLRISYAKGTENIQVEEGTSVTSYVPFGSTIESGIKMNSTMEQQAEEIANSVMYSGDNVTVKKESDKISVFSDLDGKELKRIFYLTEVGRNGCSNFYDDYLDGNHIKEARDDIAPQRFKILRDGDSTNWTVGGNHGWPCFIVNGTPLSNSDVGSVWSNGTNQFVVFSVDASGNTVFLYPCTMTSDKLSFTVTSVSGTFTHVSGGSYSTDFTVSSPSLLQNLHPSVNKRTVKMYIGNNEINADGDYSGELCKVVEQYSIIDYSDLITKIKAQGTSFDIDTVSVFATVVNSYEFRGNVCIITQTIIANHNLIIGNSGVLQATTILPNGGTVYAYCNHVASGGLASSALIDMTSYSTSNYATSENAESGKVPNRFVQINKLNGTYRYAFVMGFFPEKSEGKDSIRQNLSMFMELRNTKKMYPYCIVNKSLNDGESVTVAGFKAYCGASDIVENVEINTNSGKYVLIDAQTSGHLTIKADDTGATFVTVDDSGLTIQTDVIGGNGIDAVATGSAQSGTFKII